MPMPRLGFAVRERFNIDLNQGALRRSWFC
jgi:hypothetical protein